MEGHDQWHHDFYWTRWSALNEIGRKRGDALKRFDYAQARTDRWRGE